MAKIEFIHEATPDFPACTETIEVRAWALGGNDKQVFYIGSGVNYQASGNIWLEIIDSVEGAKIFYTRTLLQHYFPEYNGAVSLESRLNELAEHGNGRFGFGDMLPATSIDITVEELPYQDENGEKTNTSQCKLTISADTGVVFGRSSPDERSIDIQMDLMYLDEGIRFMRELLHEIQTVREGKHPNPADFPDGSSEWDFAYQLNRIAYDKIANEYQDDYFEVPLLTASFDRWMQMLEPFGKVLDVGCGNGNPVMGRLLDLGFQVTGSDFSPQMLRHARQRYPQADFLETTTTRISAETEYDGVCSFNSVVYLDPIDLLHSIYRLYLALKPGGLLFLYGYDTGPDWRGEPFGHSLGQWMWTWHYGMAELSGLLEEHGYFRVIDSQRVIVNEDREQQVEEEIENQKREEEAYYKKQAENPGPLPLPFFRTPIERFRKYFSVNSVK